MAKGQKKVAQPITIPEHFRKLFEEYGFSDDIKLEMAVATRSAEDWFAILFKQKNGELIAVDFCRTLNSKFEPVWEVQNDGIEGFETIRDFTHGKLTRTLI